MIFGLFTLLVALIISGVAAYYSIVGLTAIFSAAFVPIIIMGAALEVGKVTAAVWLKMNWQRASFTYKLYLIPAVCVLMLLTSMGIFGFLSKAHSEQNLISGDTTAKVLIVDEKIKTQRDNIALARRALEQLDKQVEERLSRGTSEQGVERAAQLRRQQQAERTKLQKDIQTAQNEIAKLNEERAPLAAAVRKVENEVGPIKYIAALIYGDNPDISLLERAVRWVIIIIVAVFDPLALVLILAAQQSLRWARHERLEKIKPIEKINPLPEKQPELKPESLPTVANIEPIHANTTEFSDTISNAYLKKPWVGFKSTLPPMVHRPEVTETPETALPVELKKSKKKKPEQIVVENTNSHEEELWTESADEIFDVKNNIRVKKLESDYYEVNDKKYSGEVFRYMYPDLAKKLEAKLQADNVPAAEQVKSNFGLQFPDKPTKGDLFLRVDITPNKLFKYNGSKWIEVDKSKTDSYTYNEEYIQFLINKLQSGEYDLDQLTATEQELVAEQIQKTNNAKT